MGFEYTSKSITNKVFPDKLDGDPMHSRSEACEFWINLKKEFEQYIGENVSKTCVEIAKAIQEGKISKDSFVGFKLTIYVNEKSGFERADGIMMWLNDPEL